jgi:membrane protein
MPFVSCWDELSTPARQADPPISTPLWHPVLATLQRVFRGVPAVWRVVTQWIDADGLRMSAAMSFYSI